MICSCTPDEEPLFLRTTEGIRQGFIFGKSALGKQRSTCHCNTYFCKEKMLKAPLDSGIVTLLALFTLPHHSRASATWAVQTQQKEREPLPQKTLKYNNSPSVEDTNFVSWVQQSARRNYIWALLLQADERLPPPTQGAHGPEVRSVPDTGQSGSAGPWVQGCLLGTWASAAWWVASHPTLMDCKVHLCREISNLFPRDKHVFGSQWFKIPSKWFQSRDKCMLVSSQEITTTSWQLHSSRGGCRRPGTHRPSAGDKSTYTGTARFPGLSPFPHCPTSEIALGRQGLGMFWSVLPC